jgi:NAD(P)-dependent dehydrogenase (short-subunit alcohol dehydrogenase family)
MTYNPFSLEGKTILVTGASSGIGRATAIECAKSGATLVLTGRDEQVLLEIREQLTCPERNHCVLTADLSQKTDLERLTLEVPMLDGCVSNAGIGKTLPVPYLSNEELERIFRLNSFAPMLLTKELVRKKKLKKLSSIVYTLSIAGNYNIIAGNSMYGSAKTAMAAFMKYAAVELSSKGIRCNAVSPGITLTPFIKNMSEENKEKELSYYPLKRYGTPEEIAYAIIYLLSDAAAWVTGTNLVIDGGRSLR